MMVNTWPLPSIFLPSKAETMSVSTLPSSTTPLFLPPPNTKPPSLWRTAHLDAASLIGVIAKHDPQNARVKALAILHSFSGPAVYFPVKNTFIRTVRNGKIRAFKASGTPLKTLSNQFSLTERQIRNIV